MNSKLATLQMQHLEHHTCE